ncbi:MAG: hypothetical protein NPIRA01_11260 [Nitrospirales bacterium]|nr:MAG: hypothetical protein NPIRA01_11260 [Nitrospirales bacterium]
MDNQMATVQQQLTQQIKIRDPQGRWRRVSSLSETEIEQIWSETTCELHEGDVLKQPLKR